MTKHNISRPKIGCTLRECRAGRAAGELGSGGVARWKPTSRVLSSPVLGVNQLSRLEFKGKAEGFMDMSSRTAANLSG
jgi:hypothetical protein